MVPFMSIGKKNGMLVGIRVDKIIIHNEEETIQKSKSNSMFI